MAGTLTATTIQNDTSSPPTFRNDTREIGTLCRAWVNFNGTGTASIRASFNVSSITDNGTGDFVVNFTNAMPDADFSCQVSLGNDSGSTNNGLWASRIFSRSTTTVRFLCGRPDNGAQAEPSDANIAIFR